MSLRRVLFGAGECGKRALDLLDRSDVCFFVDNDARKVGSMIAGIPVYSLNEAMKRIDKNRIIITVSDQFKNEIITQLENLGIFNYVTLSDYCIEKTKEKLANRVNYIDIYKRCIGWIIAHSKKESTGQSMMCNTKTQIGYPEVTGYYIPSLLRWGYRDLAMEYAKWLVSIQKADGSWYDTHDQSPYIFDSAQILKGLLSIRSLCPYVDDAIRHGCDWVISKMQDDGRLATPSYEDWGTDGSCSELIHLYCLSPLLEAAEVFHQAEYHDAALRVLSYYKENFYPEIVGFNLMSHFYAYVIEGLLDLGEYPIVKEAMGHIEELQNQLMIVPAYRDVEWVCSTGLLQFATIWFRIGNLDAGNTLLQYACKLQNQSGGWYGSYAVNETHNGENNYFPDAEISWANKFFLDAVYYKSVAEFEAKHTEFLDSIDKGDGRYNILLDAIGKYKKKIHKPSIRILDAGCGKGRYLKNFMEDMPENEYYGVDISKSVMSSISSPACVRQGTLTQIPYDDNYFDVVYACESMEHAIDFPSAVREVHRVLNTGGLLVIIDKDKCRLGTLDIEEWEQWFDDAEIREILRHWFENVRTNKNVDYHSNQISGLFCAWKGIARK